MFLVPFFDMNYDMRDRDFSLELEFAVVLNVERRQDFVQKKCLGTIEI